jgi:outer membrane protein TolC
VRKTTYAVITLILAVTAANAQDARVLSLEQAVGIALAHNKSLANATLQVEKAANDLASAKTHRLPQFQVEAQASQLLQPVHLTFPRGAFGTFDGIGPVPATDSAVTTPSKLSFLTSVEATQPLTPLLKINLNVKLQETAKAREIEQLRDSQLALIGNLKRLYYDIVQTQSALGANDRSLMLLRELNRVVGSRVTQKVALRSDALNVESKLANAEVSRVELQHTMASRKEQLNQLMGRDVRTPFEVEALPGAAAAVATLDAAQARAIDTRPDVRQARLAVKQAELARRVAKTDFIPEMYLAASYIVPTNITGAPRQIATGAVQFKWEPFDWGRKGRALATKDVELRQARNALQETEDRALVDVSSKYRAVESARAKLRAARVASDAAHESARVTIIQYGAQAALLADVLQSQSTAADADHQLQQALAAFWAAQADFERATAEDVQP